MEGTRDLFRRTRDVKGTFHARMGMIKDRHGEDLTDTEEMARIHTSSSSIRDWLKKKKIYSQREILLSQTKE